MENTALIQQLYVAYYGRPADTEGLSYWAARLEDNGGDLGEVINAFAASAEFEERFGNLSEEELVNNMYQQILGRSAEEDGLVFYTGMLARGDSSLIELALDIANGAQGTDTATLQNRVEVAQQFTQNMAERGLDYGSIEAAGQLLAGVTSATNVSEYIESAVNELLDTLPAADSAGPSEDEGDSPNTGGGNGGSGSSSGPVQLTLAEALERSVLPSSYNLTVEDNEGQPLAVDFTGENAFATLSAAGEMGDRAFEILKGARNLPEDGTLGPDGEDIINDLFQALFVYDVALNNEGKLENPPQNGVISVLEGLAAYYAQNIDSAIVMSGDDNVKTDLGTVLGLFTLEDTPDAIFEVEFDPTQIESDIAAVIKAVDIVAPTKPLSVAQAQSLQAAAEGTFVTLEYGISDSLGNVFWYGTDVNYDHDIVPQVLEAESAASIILESGTLDISSLKLDSNEGGIGVPTTLDLSETTIAGDATVVLAEINDAGNKGDFPTSSANDQKSDFTIALPEVTSLQGQLTITNITLGAYEGILANGEIAVPGNRVNDQIDVTAWNILDDDNDGFGDDLLAELSSVSVELNTDNAYLDITLNLSDGGLIILDNAVSEAYFTRMIHNEVRDEQTPLAEETLVALNASSALSEGEITDFLAGTGSVVFDVLGEGTTVS